MFSKAPVRRFNEKSDSTPPPGAYDPKFKTDVSQCSKAPTYHISSTTSLKNPSVTNLSAIGSGSRPSSPSSFSRLRSVSFQRSSLDAESEFRRNASQPPLNRTRGRGKLNVERKTTNESGLVLNQPSKDTLPSDNTSSNNHSIDIETLTLTIQELQKQLADLGKALTTEEEKTRHLIKEKEAQDNIIANLQSEVANHDSVKSTWTLNEKEYTQTIRMLQSSNDELQKLIVDGQAKYMSLIEEKESLKGQVTLTEKEKEEFKVIQKQLEESVIKLQAEANEQKLLLHESEGKCQVLVKNMDAYYHTSQEKAKAAEVEKEDWTNKEAKLQETIKLREGEIEELKGTLDREKSLQITKEKELIKYCLPLSVGSQTPQDNEIYDKDEQYLNKITALERQWSAKESTYTQKILDLEKINTSLQNSGINFANETDKMKIQEISQTKMKNEAYQNGIRLLKDSSLEENINVNHLTESFLDEEDYSVEELAADMTRLSTRDKNLSQDFDPPKSTTILDPVVQDENEEVMRQIEQLKILAKTEEEKQKWDKTLKIFRTIKNDNWNLRKQISDRSKASEMNLGNVLIPESYTKTNSEDDKTKPLEMGSTVNNDNKDVPNEETLSSGGNDTQETTESGECENCDNKDPEVVQLYQKSNNYKALNTVYSGNDPDFTKFRASPSTSRTSSSLKRSPRRNAVHGMPCSRSHRPTPSKQTLGGRRRIFPIELDEANTNAPSVPLEDVPEEED